MECAKNNNLIAETLSDEQKKKKKDEVQVLHNGQQEATAALDTGY